MSSNITGSKSKRSRLVYIVLVTIALLTVTSPLPASATSSQSQPPQSPNATCPPGGQCFADVLPGDTFYDYANRIYQQDLVSGYLCGGQGEPCDAYNRPYYRPGVDVTRGQMSKFIDNARRFPGIDIEGSSGTLVPIYTRNDNGNVIEVRTTSGIGVHSISTNNTGVYGIGHLLGVAGDSDSGYGVSGESTNNGIGVAGLSVNGIGVRGRSTNNEGVRGETGSNYAGVYGYNTNGSYQAPGVRGDGTAGPGVYGFSTSYYGVFGQSQSGCCAGVYGNNTGSFGYGVQGVSSTGYGVDGESTSNAGVRGVSTTGYGVVGQSVLAGVDGESTTGTGVRGVTATGYGVYGEATTIGGGGYAGYFQGDVQVTGSCCAAGKATTRIDDPLDPAGKYLNQSLVQSPDMTTIINGNVTTDARGEFTVSLPAWFGAANRDFRYQLTVIGQFAQAIVSSKINDNRFTIKTDKPNVEVSWQVTGIRQDPYANAHRIPVEENKPADKKGKYLHPTEYGQPASSGIDYEQQQQVQQVKETKP
jgi:hypothetical protein